MAMYWELFSIFFKIGAFTFGGGYAMLPLIEHEIVQKKNYISKREFIDLLAIAQSAPGVMAINVAVFVGYKLKGVSGAIITILGAALPSFLAILAIALFFKNFRQNEIVARIFTGIRPAVVALIAAPVIYLAQSCEVNRKTVWIPLAVAFLIWWLKVSPIYIILLAGLGGILWGKRKA